jgi:hypothetical protein
VKISQLVGLLLWFLGEYQLTPWVVHGQVDRFNTHPQQSPRVRQTKPSEYVNVTKHFYGKTNSL